MKTWEMIKELTENPEKRFESNYDGDIFIAEITDFGCFKVRCEEGHTQHSFILDREWEEVKEPVTWAEAIQASINGKKIIIEYEGKRYEQESFLKIGCLFLNGNCSNGFDRKMFIEGKWYIED